MRILALTAGAARMYCGSCQRDNTLAAELRAQILEETYPFSTLKGPAPGQSTGTP